MGHRHSDAAMDESNKLLNEQMAENREELHQKAEQMEALKMGVIKSSGGPDWNESSNTGM